MRYLRYSPLWYLGGSVDLIPAESADRMHVNLHCLSIRQSHVEIVRHVHTDDDCR